MMNRGYGYLLLLDRAGQVGGSVEHLQGKGGESDVAILRFLCGSRHPCRLRTAPFWPQWQALSCVLIACRAFMRRNKPSSFCNYLVELHLPASCGTFTYGGRRRPRVHTSSRIQGPNFDLLGTCEWLSYVRVCWSGSFPCRVYIDSSHRDTLGYLWQLVHCSHLVVCLLYLD
jgi:hypothetical protein